MNTPISIHDRTGRRSGYAFILVFTLMAIGIVLIGYLYHLSYERNFRANVESELSSIAELKVGELELWRKERLGDGAVLFKNIAFSALVRRFLEKPGDVDAQRQLQDWMGKYLTAYHYTQVYLVDTQGRMRLSMPQTPEPHASSVSRHVTEILRAGQVDIEDFHRNTPDGPVHLAVVVPIFDDLDNRRPLGVLSLRIDPTTYLYSFISKWPMPSQTAETLLVRRDGDDVLFLNELKFRKNTALNLRIPLTKTEVIAVRAALGQTGIFEGVDYRGVPVIAILCAVSDSPWSLIARMDTSEVYAPARERLWLVVSFTGFLIFASAAAMGFIWRQRSADYRTRAKVMEVIRESEARFRQLAEATFEGVVIMESGRILDVNKSFLEMFGYEKVEEVVGRSDLEFAAPEYSGLVAAHIATGYEKPYEIMAIRKDGSRFPIEVHGKTREIAGRRIRITAGRDMTERKKAEDALHHSEERLRAITDNSRTVIFMKDVAGRYLHVNRQYEKLFHVSNAAIQGKTDYDIFPRYLADAFIKYDQIVVQSGQTLEVEEQVPHDDGMHTYISVKFPLCHVSGEIYAVCGIATDITERKQAEIALQESENRFRMMSDSAPVLIWMSGTDKLCNYFNKIWLDFTGRTPEQEMGNGWAEGVHPEDFQRCLDTYVSAFDARQEFSMEYRLRRYDGEYRWLVDHGVPRHNDHGIFLGYIGSCVDISERREFMEELKRSNIELEQFSYAVSHDMRQPLRMISSYLQLIEMSLADQLDGEKRGYFDIAIEGAKRIDQMLGALLEYSRVGRMGEPPTWIESRAVLDEALQFLQPAIAEAQARLNITGDWPRILVSRDEIQRLIQNLIGNATKYRITGRIPEITVTGKMVRNEWHLCVADNGVGIIPDQIKRLFKVFQRLQTRTAYEGTGIGLALCRKIAEHHKGRIWAESAGEGQGSKFCIVLPVPQESKIS